MRLRCEERLMEVRMTEGFWEQEEVGYKSRRGRSGERLRKRAKVLVGPRLVRQRRRRRGGYRHAIWARVAEQVDSARLFPGPAVRRGAAGRGIMKK